MKERIFKDTETGETLTETKLKTIFKTLQEAQPNEYNYTFYQYLNNCTSKNGFLEEIK